MGWREGQPAAAFRAVAAEEGVTRWRTPAQLLDPRAIDDVGIGLGVSAAASAINLGVALVLLRAGTQASLDHLLVRTEDDA
jgi:hypothetical protein